MNFNLRSRVLRAVSCLVVTAILSFAASGQERGEQVFEIVPPQLRAKLVDRLREYVEYEKTGKYTKLYDLLYGTGTCGGKTTSREKYAASRQKAKVQRGPLQEFLPTFVIDLTHNDGDPPTYGITGRAKFTSGPRTVEREMTIYAKLQKRDWYFSEALDSYLHVDLETASKDWLKKGGQKLLEEVPEPLRAQLVERLALDVEYERTKQYDKLYELRFFRSTIHKDQTKEEFVRNSQIGDARGTNRRLIEFTPTAIQKIQDADGQDLYDIYGKATMCEMGELIKNPRVAISAKLQDGKWYFSTVGDVLID